MEDSLPPAPGSSVRRWLRRGLVPDPDYTPFLFRVQIDQARPDTAHLEILRLAWLEVQ